MGSDVGNEMTMRTREAGCSNVTPDKQDGLAKILRQNIAIVRTIFDKAPFCGWPRNCVYHYIDLNAGPGRYEQGNLLGSPLIFLEEISKCYMEYRAFFIDNNSAYTKALRSEIKRGERCEIINGDNRKVLSEILDRLDINPFGIVYHDPNGMPDFDMLAEFGDHPRSKHFDILIRYNAAAVKRNLHQRGRRLPDYLKGKTHWMIRRVLSSDRWQWTFLLGLNTDRVRPWEKQGFYYVTSEEGKKVLDNLTFTKSERVALRQGSLWA